MYNGYGYNGYQNQGVVNNGFSNPFGNPASSNNTFSQGYTGYNSFVTNPQPQQNQNVAHPQQQTNKKPGIRKSKIIASMDKNPNKRTFKGKYDLNCFIPVKYNTVDYFMLVENVRINNENALRDMKRGKASDILEKVLDSLEFLSYVHK